MKKHVCIIGGGFGGLSAASVLAAEGHRVSILEKNDQLGGRASSWQHEGFTFDLGPSWYLMPEVFDRFFYIVGKKREDFYRLHKLEPFYRVFFQSGKKVDIVENFDRNAELFEEFEQGGAKKLAKYILESKYKYEIAMRDFMYKEYRSIFDFLNFRIMTEGLKLHVFRRLDNYVKRFFHDSQAKKILEYAMVFLGNSPYNAPALYSIMSHVDLNLGVWFPDGGMTSVVKGFSRCAESLGVEVNCNSEVISLEGTNGRIRGARTRDGLYTADAFIVNADYAFSELNLLQNKNSISYNSRYWKSRVYAPSMFIIYLGIDKKLQNIAHHNLYFTEPWDEHFRTIFDAPSWPENPSYYVSCVSSSDPSVAPKDKENLFFLVPVAPGLEDPDEFREQYAEKILKHFETVIGEDFIDHIEVKRIFSQRDFKSNYNAYNGTALGMSHTLRQTAVFRPSIRSKKCENLYYAGQYTHPGVGVPMAIIAGELAAKAVAGDLS